LLRKIRTAGLVLVCLAATGISLRARAQDDATRADRDDDSAPPNLEAFEQAWRLIRDQFYDRGFHGVDWEACRARYLPKARAATTRRELHEVTLAMLGELKTSHTAIIEPDVYRDHVDNETKGTVAPTFGFEVTRLEAGYFVNEVAAGAPAEVGGVVRGDRLLSIDGAAPDDGNLRPTPWDVGLGGPRAYYPTPSRRARFELERRPKASREGWNRYAVELTPIPWNLIEATRSSSRTVTLGPGVSIGYVRLYHLLSEDSIDIIAEALARGPLSSAEGLVVDARGKGGLTSAVDRLCELFDPKARSGAVWCRPAVCVVDADTRSAKEILAWRWRDRKIGPLVGTKTRGAVIGARFLPLPDGAYVVLANFDMRCLTGGVSLEGKGIVPDVVVSDELPYAAGKDPCLEAGFRECLDLVLARHRAGKTHGWY
jgi:carboxyl-terminal processing protease